MKRLAVAGASVCCLSSCSDHQATNDQPFPPRLGSRRSVLTLRSELATLGGSSEIPSPYRFT